MKNLLRTIAILAVLLIGSVAVVSAESDPTWIATYWNNSNHEGDPALVRSEQFVYHNWGFGSPAPGVVNKDAFSARWTRTIEVPAGSYRFDAAGDDGIRVWVDGQLLIDGYYQHETLETISNVIYLTDQAHDIRVDFFENGGEARAQVTWDRILNENGGNANSGATQTTPWTGEYYANAGLRGSPTLVRQDPAIDFYWGFDAPADNMPENGFSVRWTNNIEFTPGRYSFSMTIDDGARLYVGDRLLINEWRSESGRSVSAEITIREGGSVPVRMEYVESIGIAQASLTWSLVYPIGGASPGTDQPPVGTAQPVLKEATMKQRTPVLQSFHESAQPLGFAEIHETVQLAGTRSADGEWIRIITAKSIWGWVPASSLDTDYPLETLDIWQAGW